MTKNQELKALKSIRNTWEISPVTRVVKDKKKYSRKEKHPQRY